MQREARRHPRHAVEGLSAVVNGVDCAIIDISVLAVRVVGRLKDFDIQHGTDTPISLEFRRDMDGKIVLPAGDGVKLNRHCDVFTVLNFEIDRTVIDDLIAEYDSFSNTALKEIF
ncbi:MAG: hypothetical protein Alpg2KO_16950 [Alphaproteobacteria bacterium]